MNFFLLTTPPTDDYALLDSGEGEKLERYGKYILRRPDPQALWNKRLPVEEWTKADAQFVRRGRQAGWTYQREMPRRWTMHFADFTFWIRPTAFKHTGLFPEQLPHWRWLQSLLTDRGGSPSVLNLFGYTGGATLAAAAAGAHVVHVDGSKVAIAWGQENALASGLGDRPIRWILDDVRTFVKREMRRGNRYDGILLDPPKFGHGSKQELWTIEKDLIPLLVLCRELLTDHPLFFILNGYASDYSAIAYGNNLRDIFSDCGGQYEQGELAILEQGSGRLLPAGIFARWQLT